MPVVGEPPFISQLLKPEQPAMPDRADNVLHRLREASPEEQPGLVRTYLQKQVTQVMGLDPFHPLSPRQPWLELGVDSLMSVDLMNRISRELNVTIPVKTIMQGGSTQTLTELIQDQLDTFDLITEKESQELEIR